MEIKAPLDWTEEEIEKFSNILTSECQIDAGLLSGNVASNGSWVSDFRYFTIDEIEQIIYRGIHVTSIVPPEQGWPIAMYCPICKETTFMLSFWAVKPKDGDYFIMNNTCANEEHCHQHNMKMTMGVKTEWIST